MDIQFMTNVYACVMYIASYVTKSQRGMGKTARKLERMMEMISDNSYAA